MNKQLSLDYPPKKHSGASWRPKKFVFCSLFRGIYAHKPTVSDAWMTFYMCFQSEFLMPNIFVDKIDSDRGKRVLKNIPFCLTFEDRVKLFYHYIQTDKREFASDHSQNVPGFPFARGHGQHITIRRNLVLEV